jgi:hypothetical protein
MESIDKSIMDRDITLAATLPPGGISGLHIELSHLEAPISQLSPANSSTSTGQFFGKLYHVSLMLAMFSLVVAPRIDP